MKLTKKSFAKINLFLHLTGKRDDGYHELCSLMVQIGLWDEIQFSFEGNGIRVFCDHPHVPGGKENLAYKAAELFFCAYEKHQGRFPLGGVAVRIKKQIPPGGGLGGGSSNAATVLMALNEYCAFVFSRSELMVLGLKLGADVPFFIFGVPALATGVGEILEKYPELPELYVVLCDPGVAASTPDVFKNIDFRLTSGRKCNRNTGSNVLLGEQGGDGWGKLHNDLEVSACRLYPEIASAKGEMEFLLKRDVYMSGSGSSLFALFSGPEAARKAYELLAKQWSRGQVFLAPLKRYDLSLMYWGVVKW
ncbi:MAG: 4-(cytidine 5'-diphospho)-2-C-methyl-D-erythritol kinase [Desulfobacteraceae bacterium]|nr:4-(cytidine 5'-diphospho)-2-C-methyl-D-erythritol kinase [Desulfobacteraceae bacterium]